ncbi:acyl carrier protein [Azospirillum sp. ST 5-10]|uniref:acyl carrier protein n=1 Tax=unclassified Azospirillum TaxID=2630922 RepID=UPI003F4A1A67
MTPAESLSLIVELLAAKLREKGLEPPAIDAGTRLLGGDLGIDSLDLATVVVELEERTGKDPFREGFVTFQTAGELAALYAAAPG